MVLPEGRLKRGVLALTGLALLGVALLAPPINGGDAAEYVLMTESLFRHGSPDVRPADIRALGSLEVKSKGDLNFLDAARGYFDSPRGGRYSYHFWGYSLLTLPAKGVLRLLRAKELAAAPLTNAILLFLALAACLQAKGTPARQWGLFLLSLFSPALFLLLWPHTEVATFAFVTLAVLLNEKGEGALAVLAAALAAMQNPPLGIVVLVFMVEAVVRGPGSLVARSGRVILAALPAVIPMVFFYREFGTASLIGREAASTGMVSLKKALELFLDPNIGLLPFLPVTLLLFGVQVFRALAGKEAPLVLRNAALLALLALGCTLTLNWNHGTSGPSRYTFWMLPLLFEGVLPPGSDRSRFVSVAIASQAFLVLAHGGPVGKPDHLEHSFAARQVLRWAPGLYHPTPDIFVLRTLHHEGAPEGAVIYQSSGVCLKAYARPEDDEALRSVCGGLGTNPGGRGFRYVDF